MKQWLFNPFIKIAGGQALVIGWAVMLLGAITGYYSKIHFDGVIQVHKETHTPGAPIYFYFIEPLVDWGCVTLLFYIAGRMFSRSAIRFIDVAGTFALARWVMIFPAIIGFFLIAPDTGHTVNELVKSISPLMISLALLSLVFVIWMIALMYNAFTVSCNLKGGNATAIFVVTLICSEVLSEIILYQLHKHLVI